MNETVPGRPQPVSREAADAAFSLQGRLAMVTGGGRGIGAAIAYLFVASGARVLITHPGTDASTAEADEVVERSEGNIFSVAADASDLAATEKAVAVAEAHFNQRIDTLVANAAHQKKLPWDEIPLEQWDRMMAVNVRGAFVAARAVAPSMRAGGYGKILTVGSVMAHIGDPRSLDYVTSKSALVGLSRSLARAEGPNGIRVNCVVPGAITSEHHFEIGGSEDVPPKLQTLLSVQRLGKPEDIAHACRYLVSPAGDYVTGQVFAIDGGWSYP